MINNILLKFIKTKGFFPFFIRNLLIKKNFDRRRKGRFFMSNLQKKRVTTRDIARACGVSQSTVSMILSGKKEVSFSEETKKKVFDTAKALGYEPPAKKNVSLTHTCEKTIIVICPTLSSQYYITVIESVAAYGEDFGYTTFTAHTGRKKELEEKYLEMARHMKAAGIIFTYPPQQYRLINEVARDIPVVLVSDPNEKLRVNTIELHSQKPGMMVAEHLISLGHRRIAYLTTPLNEKEIPRVKRLEGIREAYRLHGLDPEKILVKIISPQKLEMFEPSRKYFDTGYYLTMEILEENPSVTAFVGTTDMVSMGIMEALAEKGYSVPDDYSVCGFDNNFLSSVSRYSLTSVDHSVSEKGMDAVDIIRKYGRSAKRGQKSKPIFKMEYEPRLVVRNSTGPVRKW